MEGRTGKDTKVDTTNYSVSKSEQKEFWSSTPHSDCNFRLTVWTNQHPLFVTCL